MQATTLDWLPPSVDSRSLLLPSQGTVLAREEKCRDTFYWWQWPFCSHVQLRTVVVTKWENQVLILKLLGAKDGLVP